MKTAFTHLKQFSEKVFDLLMGNAGDTEVSVFNDVHYTEWNGDDASIDFYPNIDRPHDVKPHYRLFCADGNKPHPVTLWVYWCSNYGEPEKWIREIWPAETEYSHFLSKFMSLRRQYSGDETMNRFFRELSSGNQRELIHYVMTEYKY